jgi:type II secretory pathway pseudopilin PulG
MKLLSANMPSHRARAVPPAVSAFTIVEMVTVAAIFAVVVISMVELQIFALRIYTLAATKTTATETGRKALNKMRDAIRSANIAYVGNYSTSGGGFSIATNGTGNALQLILDDTNGNLTISNTFYLDLNQPVSADQPYDFPLCYLDNNGQVTMLVNFLTNYYVFQAEDYLGNCLSNSIAYQNNGVIHVTMQFDQWEYPVGFIGGNAINSYDFYNLTTRVTRRCKSQ